MDSPPPGFPAGTRHYLVLKGAGGPWLGIRRTRDIVMASLRSWHGEHDGRILLACLMPDRAHLLIEQGRLAVPSLVDRWKATVRIQSGYPQTFEHEFWGHPLRADESIEDYGLHLYLKPYQAAVIAPVVAFSGTWIPDPAVFQFTGQLNAKGAPLPEWLKWTDERFAALTRAP